MVATQSRCGSRAGGKITLLGEHAVVYGEPAVAVGLDRGATATATPVSKGPSRLRVRAWNIDVSAARPTTDIARAFRLLLDAARTSGFFLVDIETELAPGAGLGCSAAVAVAVARALDPRADDEAVEERAMAWERVFHGNPSGVDAAVAARGGCVFFQRGRPIESLSVARPLFLCAGSTGLVSSTRAMVESVARLCEVHPTSTGAVLRDIGALARRGRVAIETGDLPALGRLMNDNHALLGGLGVSTAKIEDLCAAARGAGALGAKLTGAGGGGNVIALAAGVVEAKAVLDAWLASGHGGFLATVPAAPELARAAGGDTS
jgi:mevalonate kinase